MARHHYIEDPDKLKEIVEDVVQQIHDEADPHEMNEYKRFVKRHVSVFSRAYFTAFLLKQLAEGNENRPRKKARAPQARRTTRNDSAGSDNGSDGQGGGTPTDGEQQTLFVSVGKNRRVFPKDFVALLTEIEGVSGDQIGQIKILDSYSFIEVATDVSERIIETYNGYEYRGRKLTVNYARSKKN